MGNRDGFEYWWDGHTASDGFHRLRWSKCLIEDCMRSYGVECGAMRVNACPLRLAFGIYMPSSKFSLF